MLRFKLIYLVVMLGLVSFSVQAQTLPPLILWVRGDLYMAWDFDASPVQLTQNGTISGPALSPDENMIAYKAAAPVGLQALDRVQTSGFIAEFDLPGDIYVLNIPTLQTALVAGQPDDASLFVEGVPDNAVVRSTPEWSPDGAMLAWTELAFGGDSLRLVIFDYGTRLQTIAADALPLEIVLGSAPEVRWGAGGIAVIGDQGKLLLYRSDGTLLSSPEPTPTTNETVQEYAWVDASGTTLFGVLYDTGRWALYDPTTGVEQQIEGTPLMVGLSENSLALRFSTLPDLGIFWETVDPSGATTASGAFPAPPSRVTLSPSGREVAFIGYPDFGGAAVWQNGEILAVPGTGSDGLAVGAVLWGAVMWQIGS